MHTDNKRLSLRSGGFTLLELTIILTVVGLIVGGILASKDIISAAAIRSQIGQVSSYQNAMHAFQTKYNCMPGDCKNPGKAGLAAMTGNPAAGQGDGDEVLQGIDGSNNPGSYILEVGETALFWVHLAQAGFIEGNFKYYNYVPCGAGLTTGGVNCPDRVIADYMPLAKLGRGNIFIYVYSYNGVNYFGVSTLTQISTTTAWPNKSYTQYPGITTQQAYAIDQKMDDGFPLTGNVVTQFPVAGPSSPPSNPGSAYNTANSGASSNAPATPGDTTTCYDNNNVAGAMQQYSVRISKGDIPNCALSFVFQ